MKNTNFFVALLFAFNVSNAQFSMTTKKEALQIKNSVLLVALEEEDAKRIKKLSNKPEKLEHYRTQIAGRNRALKNAVEKYWSFSSKVEYTTESKAKEMLETEKDKYVMISFGEYLDYESFRTHTGMNGSPAGWGGSGAGMSYNPSTKYTELANVITTLLISDPGKIIKAFLPNVYPSEADAVYGIQQIQYILNYLLADEKNTMVKFMAHIRNNAPELKNKTLLIDKDDLSKKLTESDVKEVYPYPFKIVSQKEIDKAILEKDPTAAYVQIADMPGGKGNVSAHYVSNAADGKIYCYDAPTVSFGIKGMDVITYGERITKKYLKNYCENVK